MSQKSERLYQRALHALDQGNWLKAYQWLLQALEADPEDLWVLRLLAELCLHHGHLSKAKDFLQQALLLQPDDPDSRFLLANALLLEGHPREALRHYHFLERELGEPYSDLLFHMGLAYASLKQSRRAIHYLEQALQEDPTVIETYEILARLYQERNDRIRLQWVLTQLLDLDPHHSEAQAMMGALLREESLEPCPESR